MRPAARFFLIIATLSLGSVSSGGQQPAEGNPPTGTISCTSKVSPTTCKSVSSSLQFIQAFPLLRSVDLLIADPDAFAQMRGATIDIVFAKAANLQGYIPIRHSSLDDNILFEVARNSQVRRPDRVVISTDIFRPLKAIKPVKQPSTVHEDTKQLTFEYASALDSGLVSEYSMFIQGYIEGCSGARQPGE